jgi:hypothetical protein
MLQRSDKRFSTGVPVSAARHRAGSWRAAQAARVAAFLMFCASSRMTSFHSTAASAASSRWSSA